MFISYHLLADFGRVEPLSRASVESIIGVELPSSATNLMGEVTGFQENYYRARWDMAESDIEALVSSTEGKVLGPLEYPLSRSEHDPDWWNPGQGESIGESKWKKGPPDFYVYLYFVRQEDVCRAYLVAHDT